MLSLDAKSDVGRHDATGNVGHPAGHDAHQFRFCEFAEKWPDCEWRLRLSHEDTGGNVERLRAARAHHPRHDPSGSANDELHYANVVQERKKSSDENDGGEYLKGEGEAEQRSFLSDFAENEFRANVGKTQQAVHCCPGGLKDSAANIKAQNKEGKGNLQAESPENGFQPDGLAFSGEQVCETDHCG